MFLDCLFVLFIAIPYAEPLLNRLVGKLVAGFLLAVSALGLCSIIAAFIAEAM